MKQVLVRFALQLILRFILGNGERAKLTVGLAEASRQAGDVAFTRRGRIYRQVKEWAPAGTPLHLVNLGTEIASTLDEMSRK